MILELQFQLLVIFEPAFIGTVVIFYNINNNILLARAIFDEKYD